MNDLYLDIETIPSQETWVREYIIDTIKPPGNIKKKESIEKWYEEKLDDAIEEAYEKLSFDGAMCHTIAIGYAVNDDKAECFYAENHKDEKKILESFFDLASGLNWPRVIGHNVTGFDMKILRQRAIILDIDIPKNLPWSAKPWDNNPFCTMMQWDGKNYISIDKLARAMGIEGKGDIDGSMVYKLWKNGKHEKNKAYCIDDVEMVRKIAKRMF